MTAWPQLFGDELATTTGGQQTLFPTNEHLGGEKYCMVIATTYICPRCPGFFRSLRAWKPAMADRGVAIVVCYMVDTERQHLQMAEEYGEVQMPIGFPTPPELLERKRHIGELLGKSVPSYAVFDRNLEMVVDVATANLGPLVAWLKTLEPTAPNAAPVEPVAAEEESPELPADAPAEAESAAESSEPID